MAECIESPPRTEGSEGEGEAPVIRKPAPKTKSSRSASRNRARSSSAKDEEIRESLERLKSQGKYVKLNVGGSLYCTTLGTLTKHDNMLRAMFSGRMELETDDEGMYTVPVVDVAWE